MGGQRRLSQALQRWLWAAVPYCCECLAMLAPAWTQSARSRPSTGKCPPVFWRDKLLVLRETCLVYWGGAHPSGGLGSYLAYPACKDMVFSPMLPHVVQACADDSEVPCAQLRPHLTPAGLAALEARLSHNPARIAQGSPRPEVMGNRQRAEKVISKSRAKKVSCLRLLILGLCLFC